MKRLVLEGAGWILIVAGVGALVLPGPGLLMIFAGLALLSRQYTWAADRLEPVRLRALRSAAEGVETPVRTVLSTLFALAIGAVGILWIASPPAPSWWPLERAYWLLGGAWTGATLLVSCALALGLIVYSYRRFHGDVVAREELERDIRSADERDEDAGRDDIPR